MLGISQQVSKRVEVRRFMVASAVPNFGVWVCLTQRAHVTLRD